MEKKKKQQHKSGSNTYQESDHLLNEEGGQNQPGANKNTSGSSSRDNAHPLSQQFQPNFQWPYSAQPDVQQTPLISMPFTPSQSPSPISQAQWQQNSQLHQAQAAMPLWLAQQNGYPFPGPYGAATPYPFIHAGTTDATWQGTTTVNRDFSSGNPLQPSPSYPYPFGYQYPGFPGPWGPSPWWGQLQQPSTHLTCTNPAASGYFSSPSFPAGCLPASAPSYQRGIIQPPPRFSQKHQQLWEAQSAENVQLWNVVGHLQSELANYKNLLTNLEADVLSLKPTAKQPAANGVEASSPGEKKTKRGRPKKRIAPNDVNPFSDKSLPRERARKPAARNTHGETKEQKCDKYSQKKLEGKVDIQKEIDNRIVISTSNPKEMENIGKFVWPINMSTGYSGKGLINFHSQNFYSDCNASGHENVAIESGSNENEQIEDIDSSRTEDKA